MGPGDDDAVRAGSSQPCPDGFCDDHEVRAFVRQTCETNGWPPGHQVLVQTADGSWCYCQCPSGSPCAADWCQRPEIRASVDAYCAQAGLLPGARVVVESPDGYCTCTCGDTPRAEPADGAARP